VQVLTPASNVQNTPVPQQPVASPNAPGTQENNNPVFKPLDESHNSDRSENRRNPDNRPNEVEQEASQNRDREAQAASEESQRKGEARQAQEQQEQQQDLQEIEELASRDREVRAHEQAHSAVGGQYAGAPSYTYERGPDGRAYAVAGEVPIDISKIPDNPQATLIKAEQVRRAALAPAEPSPQDRQVAAQATQIKLQAQVELAEQQREESSSEVDEDKKVEGSKENERAIEDKEELEKAQQDEQEDKPNAAERFAQQNSQFNAFTQRINELSALGKNSGGQVNQFI